MKSAGLDFVSCFCLKNNVADASVGLPGPHLDEQGLSSQAFATIVEVALVLETHRKKTCVHEILPGL